MYWFKKIQRWAMAAIALSVLAMGVATANPPQSPMGMPNSSGSDHKSKTPAGCAEAPAGMDTSTLMTFYCDPQSPNHCPQQALCGEKPAEKGSHTGKSPTNKDETLCCHCVYMENGACGGQTKSTCSNAHKDCRWVSGMGCQTRHKTDCQNWMAAPEQQECDNTVITPTYNHHEPSKVPFVDEKPSCDSYRFQYEGHGRPKASYINQIKVCLEKLPECTNFSFVDTGCCTFDNVDNAYAEVERLTQELGGSQCVTLRANQCNSGNGWQTYMLFSVNSNGICMKKGQGCEIGKACQNSQVNQSMVCTDPKTQFQKEQVCCENIFGLQYWREGNVCQ